jgi:DNA-binding MarR family transcriptional regulator
MPDRRVTSLVEMRLAVGQCLRALGSDLDWLDEAVADGVGLHRTDLRCLEIVAREGPISAGRLAALAGLSTSAMTSVIDRIQRVGYVRIAAAAHV